MSQVEKEKKSEIVNFTLGDACECLLDGIQSNNTHSRFITYNYYE